MIDHLITMDHHNYDHNFVWITSIYQIHSGMSMVIMIMHVMNGYDHAKAGAYQYYKWQS